MILWTWHLNFGNTFHLLVYAVWSSRPNKAPKMQKETAPLAKRSSIIPLHPPNRSVHRSRAIRDRNLAPQPYKKSHPKYSALEIFVPKHSWAPPPCTPSTRSQPPAIAKKRSARTEAVAWHRPIGNSKIGKAAGAMSTKRTKKRDTSGIGFSQNV